MRPDSKGTELASPEEGTVIRAEIPHSPPQSYGTRSPCTGQAPRTKVDPPKSVVSLYISKGQLEVKV